MVGIGARVTTIDARGAKFPHIDTQPGGDMVANTGLANAADAPVGITEYQV